MVIFTKGGDFMKKILSIFFAVTMCVSLSVPVLADFQYEATPQSFE